MLVVTQLGGGRSWVLALLLVDGGGTSYLLKVQLGGDSHLLLEVQLSMVQVGPM